MKYMNNVRYIFLPATILIILLTLAFYSKIMKEKAKEISLEKSNYTTILQLSASQSDSKPIQDFLVKEIKSGDKSNFTQSAAAVSIALLDIIGQLSVFVGESTEAWQVKIIVLFKNFQVA